MSDSDEQYQKFQAAVRTARWRDHALSLPPHSLLEALKVAVAQLEDDEVKIDGEWGGNRTLEQLEADWVLCDAIYIGRAAIKAAEADHG